MPDGKRAERVILISLMKSGTHLMKELMVALGYGMYGHVRVTPEIRPALDRDARRQLASTVYGEEEAARLKSLPEPLFNESTDRAWETLAFITGTAALETYWRDDDVVQATRRKADVVRRSSRRPARSTRTSAPATAASSWTTQSRRPDMPTPAARDWWFLPRGPLVLLWCVPPPGAAD